MPEYLNAKGQVLIMSDAGKLGSPRAALLLTTDGKKGTWECFSWKAIQKGAKDEGYKPMDFLIAYARRHMLEHDVQRFEVVVCNVAGSETIENINPEGN